MESKFHDNGVITGIADSFCLACNKYLKLKDAYEHINDSAHHTAFKSTTYLEKFQEDRIRKVKIGYFCEICNLIIQTSAKISIHVNDVAHINNKNTKHLKESDKGVVAFDDILIEENAWHGLTDRSCLICNVDYSDEEVHKREPTHILKLIQSKFEFYKNNFVYRKVDEDSFNCLTCNTIITEESKEKHMNESEHKIKYSKCIINNKYVLETGIPNSVHNEDNNEKNYATVSKTVSDSESLADKSDSETKIVAYVNDQNKKNAEQDHIELLSPPAALKKAKEFAQMNRLKYKRNSTYCEACDVRMSSSLKIMKEHVGESTHKENAANNMNRKLNKVPMPIFINVLEVEEYLYFKQFLINGDIRIGFWGFQMLRRDLDSITCLLCEDSIAFNRVDRHVSNSEHLNALKKTQVLTDFSTEFVREMRPDIYHCGICNLIENGLNSLKNHLKSTDHLQIKLKTQNFFSNLFQHIVTNDSILQYF